MNPVVVDGGLLDLQWLATRENLHVVRAVGVRHFAGKDVLVRLAQGLISGDAEDLLAPPVDEEEAAAGVLQVDERGRVIEDRPQPLLALAQYVLCACPLPDLAIEKIEYRREERDAHERPTQEDDHRLPRVRVCLCLPLSQKRAFLVLHRAGEGPDVVHVLLAGHQE